jgi:hypothetical protein
LEDIENENNSEARQQGIDVREYFAEYFMLAGAVPFQYQFIYIFYVYLNISTLNIK